jgi:hypothetical protein
MLDHNCSSARNTWNSGLLDVSLAPQPLVTVVKSAYRVADTSWGERIGFEDRRSSGALEALVGEIAGSRDAEELTVTICLVVLLLLNLFVS